MTSYAAVCRLCEQTILTAETIRPEEVERLAEHLRAKHPREIVGVRIWRQSTVMQHFRLTVV